MCIRDRTWDKNTIQRFWLHTYGMLDEPVNLHPTTEDEEAVYKRAVATIGDWSQRFDLDMQELRPPNGATAWNAANAVTNWVQHKVNKRGRKMSSESRIDRNLFGKNATDSVRVMRSALEFV